MLGLLAADGLALAHAVLVHAEQAHDKAGRAETALRAVAVDHGGLGRVEAGGRFAFDQRVARQVLHRPQRQAIDRMRHAYAAVDGRVAQRFAARGRGHGLANDHGAGAAVAFGAAFLGAGAAQVLAQDFEKRALGGHIAQCHGLAAANELQNRQGHESWRKQLWEKESQGRRAHCQQRLAFAPSVASTT
ncbi:hypothetical protein D3C85_1359760 [compost metagenome]